MTKYQNLVYIIQYSLIIQRDNVKIRFSFRWICMKFQWNVSFCILASSSSSFSVFQFKVNSTPGRIVFHRYYNPTSDDLIIACHARCDIWTANAFILIIIIPICGNVRRRRAVYRLLIFGAPDILIRILFLATNVVQMGHGPAIPFLRSPTTIDHMLLSRIN